MAFDQTTRNRLARFVGDCRAMLTEEFTRQLQSIYGMDPDTADIADLDSLTLTSTQYETARLLRETLDHYLAGHTKQDKKTRIAVLSRIVREQAFTVLNRLCAIRMAESRDLTVECIGKGHQSKGFQLYRQLAGTSLGETGDAYRVFLFSVFDEFAVDLPVLFDRFSPQGRLFPREAAFLELLDHVNHAEIEPLWAEDETIGWIYQYFNSVEERREMRAASQAPRNSRELAVRNQFFTPRYVVEFLTDNTLGRIWYEMTEGETSLKDSCRYLVHRPNEIFLAEGEEAPEQKELADDLSQEELLEQPVHIPRRPLKDPRDIKMLDPACGSMHFGLYAFDLFERIYDEAWDLEAVRGADAFVRPEGLNPLHATYESKESFIRDVPRLIIERNIHGIDIDPRAVQIAGLSLWLRAQRSWHGQDIAASHRPQIQRSNIVCAEPMPGEEGMLEEFLTGLRNTRLESLIRRVLNVPENQQVRATARMADALCDLVRTVWKEMELAGEAGSLLRIEESLADAIAEGKEEWEEKFPLFRVREFGLGEVQPKTSYVKFIPGEEEDFWSRAEALVLTALQDYAERTQGADGLRRRMFSKDAARGFAFVDLCRYRYDTVLMNPPFGLAPERAFEYARRRYPRSYTELLATFVDRGLDLSSGRVGAITSRSFMVATRLADWRADLIAPRLKLIGDLGSNVMDDALVQAAAFVVDADASSDMVVLDCRDTESIAHELADAAQFASVDRLSLIDPQVFRTFPGCRLVYKVARTLSHLLCTDQRFEPNAGTARQGLATWDDFRFVRLFWETDPHEIGYSKTWEYLSKGGAYSRYASNVHLVMKWRGDGRESCAVNISKNGTDAQARQASEYWRRPGLTYSIRSAKGFSARLLPGGCLFTGQGPLIVSTVDSVTNLFVLGWINSKLIRGLIQVQSNAGKFMSGLIKSLPWRAPNARASVSLEKQTSELLSELIACSATCECSPYFTGIQLRESIQDTERVLIERLARVRERQLQLEGEWDTYCCDLYEVTLADANELLEASGGFDDEDEDGDETAIPTDQRTIAENVVSLAVGRVLGRWSHSVFATEPDPLSWMNPFEPIPDSQPARSLPRNGESIAVSDDGNPQDLSTRIQDLISTIVSPASGLEEELASLLGATLFEYLVSPTRFFASHLQRYSASRRWAPVYWPLASSSGRFILWLHYPDLTTQTLYRCVNDFVEPKLRHVHEEAVRLRESSDRSSTEERELERLSELELELADFRDELLRIAKFWRPNLDDGVQITAAPLWKLFRHRQWQNRLKTTWEKLEAGEYDWAHLALSIWPDRVVRASHKNRSYAIAHDLEDQLWEEVEVEKKTRGGKVKNVMEWRPRDLSESELQKIVAEVKAR